MSKLNNKCWLEGMRDAFFRSLYNLARRDKNVVLITSDTGAICHDDFRRELKKQYINVGIAEQNMVGISAGLAMSGKTVYIYAIIPFVTMRCYEQIRIDLCCMNLPVTVVGVGAGYDYSTLGPTHHGTEDISLMRSLPGMTIYSPSDSLMADIFAKVCYEHKLGPKYIRLDREGVPLIHKDKKDINISQGFSLLKDGKDLYIIATGRMVLNALKISKELASQSIDAGVIDLFRIKPLNKGMIWNIIKSVKYVMTLEEHFISAGIGGAIAEMLAEIPQSPLFKAFGIDDQFCRVYGERRYLQRFSKIDVESVTNTIVKWIER